MPLSLDGLNASESHWIDFVRDHVVGRLSGTAAERARVAALVTWWALKEGVLDVQPSPWRHSLCGARQLGDLEVCQAGAWQLGMGGIQPGLFSLGQVESIAAQLYPGVGVQEILRRTAGDAGLDAQTAAIVEGSEGALRKAWLLRDPAISFTLQAPAVETQCLSRNAPSWCFGGWQQARAFASSPGRVAEVVKALESYFGGGSRGPAVVVLVGLGVFLWGLSELEKARGRGGYASSAARL